MRLLSTCKMGQAKKPRAVKRWSSLFPLRRSKGNCEKERETNRHHCGATFCFANDANIK